MNYLNLEQSKVKPVVSELNKFLADLHVHYQNLRTFHWNVTGKHFFDLHEQFEKQYNLIKVMIDEVAERVLTLRHRPISCMSDYLKISNIEEAARSFTSEVMIATILEDHGVLVRSMRSVLSKAADANDEGTIDLIAGHLGQIEKTSWMLNAWSTNTTEAAFVETVSLQEVV